MLDELLDYDGMLLFDVVHDDEENVAHKLGVFPGAGLVGVQIGEDRQDNLADGVVSSDDYRSMKTRFSKELNEAQNELNHLQAHDSSKESLIRKAVEALNNLGVNYRNSSADRKIKLVGSIFPEMIEFDGNKCRTPKINEAAALCLNVDGRLRGNKKGTLHLKWYLLW